MAESFFTIIDRGTIEVTHIGEEAFFTLPEIYQELKGKLEDEDEIKAWIDRHDMLLHLFYKFIQKDLIDCRAVIRPATKVFKDPDSFNKAVKELKNPNDWHILKSELKLSRRMSTCLDECQKRLDEKDFGELPKRPGQSGKAAVEKKATAKAIEATIKGMLGAGLEDNQIKEILGSQFDKATISLALNNAHSELD